MGVFIEGYLWGLSLALLLGPAFFALIQTSIQRSFKYGFLMAFGIFLSDVIAVALVYFGATQILGEDPHQNIYFSIIGGIVMVIFGTITAVKKDESKREEKEGKELAKGPSRPIVYISKGFFMNFFNPGMWFFWMTVAVSITARFGSHNISALVFLSGMLVSVFSTDSLKCFVSHKIKRWMKPRIMVWMNRIVGVVLILFGIYLILNVMIDISQFIPA